MKLQKISQIKKWLCEMQIKNFTIHPNLIVDVDGNVDLYDKGLTEIPIQFGIVNGNFQIHVNKLTSLNGCPKIVNGSIAVTSNKLTSLEGIPQYIGDKLYCGINNLKNFKVSYKVIIGDHAYFDGLELPNYVINKMEIFKAILKYQEDYDIWNNDGVLNVKRWEIFISDYTSGELI